jgi:threonine/homoserine/homoserine lactone efflux protein
VLSDVLQLIGTLLLVWLGVRYGVRPLRALSAQIAKRSAREGSRSTGPRCRHPAVQDRRGHPA